MIRETSEKNLRSLGMGSLLQLMIKTTLQSLTYQRRKLIPF